MRKMQDIDKMDEEELQEEIARLEALLETLEIYKAFKFPLIYILQEYKEH